MRLIGQLDGEASARKFSDYLLVQGIENEVEPDKEGSWAVWIHAEDDLEKARSLLADFRERPAAAGFAGATHAAQAVRGQKKQDRLAYEKRLQSRRQLFRPLSGYGFGPLTFVLICACAVVFVLTDFGRNWHATRELLITNYSLRGDIIEWLPGLPEIRGGEVWRLVTPMLLHGDIWHIFFNMWWLRDLGSMVEGRQNSRVLAVLVVGLAAVSNLAQYWMAGPAFGGMSGVVYGLLGYIWIRGKFDPGSGLSLHPTTVQMMIIWLVIGFSGFLNMANYAHLGGLAMGMAWGWLSSLRHH